MTEPGEAAVPVPQMRVRRRSDLLLDELLGRAAHGDEAALRALVAAVHPMVVRYCRARLGGACAEADDVARDIDIAVGRVVRGRRIVGELFPGLVYGIALRKVTQVGLEYRRPTKLGRWLEVLAPHEREVLILRIHVGLKCEHAAQTLGVTPGEVRAIQHRALDRLRQTVNTCDEPRQTGRS